MRAAMIGLTAAGIPQAIRRQARAAAEDYFYSRLDLSPELAIDFRAPLPPTLELMPDPMYKALENVVELVVDGEYEELHELSGEALAIEDLRRRVEDDWPEALVLPPREHYGIEALEPLRGAGRRRLGVLPGPVDRERPRATAHRRRDGVDRRRALPRLAQRHPPVMRAKTPSTGGSARASLAVPNGPVALLRRHRRLRAHAEARPARAAAARRGRADPVRLRRGHPAPAAAQHRAARPRRDLHHPPAPRPLARAAGDDQDVRHARPRPAAGRLRPARAERALPAGAAAR